jgi:hypothetical protein
MISFPSKGGPSDPCSHWPRRGGRCGGEEKLLQGEERHLQSCIRCGLKYNALVLGSVFAC